jgi:hypothetical protein
VFNGQLFGRHAFSWVEGLLLPGDCRHLALNVQYCAVSLGFGCLDIWTSLIVEHKMRFPAFQTVKRESSTKLELTRSGRECLGERNSDTVFGWEVFAIYDSEPEDLPVLRRNSCGHRVLSVAGLRHPA